MLKASDEVSDFKSHFDDQASIIIVDDAKSESQIFNHSPIALKTFEQKNYNFLYMDFEN